MIYICTECGGDGGWSVENSFDPFTGRIGYRDIVCDACGGEGRWEVEPEPIEEEDLDEYAPVTGVAP